MRIANSTIHEHLVRNLGLSEQKLIDLQDQLSSGKKIRHPHDDPNGAAYVLDGRERIANLDQQDRNITAAKDWLNGADTQLSALTPLLQRAKELAIQGATGTVSPSDRQLMSNELDQILRQAITVGNSTVAGKYLFAGLKTSTAPFTLNAGSPNTVTYNGDTGSVVMRVDNGVDLSVNVTGNRGFPAAFSALADVLEAFKTGQPPTDPQMSALDSAIDTNVGIQAELGAKMNRIESIQNRAADDKLNITDAVSKVEEPDFVALTMQLQAQQNVYTAALQVGSKVIQTSLLQFLR